MMDMNKTKELAWELGQKLGEVAEDAYKQGYSNGIKDGNINNGTFSEKVNEAYNNGLNDAWEAAREIAGNQYDIALNWKDLEQIFGSSDLEVIFSKNSASEAIQMIREYKERWDDPVINIQMGEQSDKVDCYNTDCINCINHNDCDYEDQTPRQDDEIKVGDEIANDYEKRESCENCKYGYKPSYTEPCYSCGNGKDGYEPLDENITTALCSLHKIQSSDGQDYVQLYDVLETVRGYEQLKDLGYGLGEKPKTGHWIEMPIGFKCSNCNELEDRTTKYCPNCGAKMFEPQEREDKCKNCKYYRNPDYTRCHECEAERSDKE